MPSTNNTVKYYVPTKALPYLSVYTDSGLICKIAFDKKTGKPLVSIPDEHVEVTFENITSDQVELINTVIEFAPDEEEQSMEFPSYQSKVVFGSPTSKYGSPLDERSSIGDTRDDILDLIIQSYIDYPNQSKTLTSRISHEIAEKLDVKVMTVAGVRANLARGSYDQTLEQMIAAKRKART